MFVLNEEKYSPYVATETEKVLCMGLGRGILIKKMFVITLLEYSSSSKHFQGLLYNAV